MVKNTNGKAAQATKQNDVHQPVVGKAEPRQPNVEYLAKTFAPAIEHRAVKDLKVNHRNARSHSDRQVQQIATSVRCSAGWRPSWLMSRTPFWPATAACVRH